MRKCRGGVRAYTRQAPEGAAGRASDCERVRHRIQRHVDARRSLYQATCRRCWAVVSGVLASPMRRSILELQRQYAPASLCDKLKSARARRCSTATTIQHGQAWSCTSIVRAASPPRATSPMSTPTATSSTTRSKIRCRSTLTRPVVEIERQRLSPCGTATCPRSRKSTKTRSFASKCRYLKRKKVPAGNFIVGRHVMTRRAEDIQFAGLICQWEDSRQHRRRFLAMCSPRASTSSSAAPTGKAPCSPSSRTRPVKSPAARRHILLEAIRRHLRIRSSPVSRCRRCRPNRKTARHTLVRC